MAQTIIGVNDPIAVKRYSATLFRDYAKESYWGARFMSKSAEAPVPVQVLTELESDAGDTVHFDLFAQLKQKPTYGDAQRRGKEERLNPFSDKVHIDQVWCGVNGGGRMSRKRTLHDLRAVSRRLMTEWWARFSDETFFSYSAGSRGNNSDFIEDVGWNGFAGNALHSPDADHLLFGGDATSKSSISNDDGMDLPLIDRLVTKAKTMGGGTDGKMRIRPIKIGGETRYVLVMHTFAEHQLRTATGTGDWMELQKQAGARGGKNPLFTGAMGMYRGVILHSHQSSILFDDAGATNDVAANAATFMGAQSLVAAFGSPGSGLRFDWHEEQDNRGNDVVIGSSTILGVKKTRFDNRDFGGLTAYTYAPDPNA